MTRRLSVHHGLVVGTAALALWLAGPTAAQDRVPLKTAWGDPSLEGTWSSATVTPRRRDSATIPAVATIGGGCRRGDRRRGKDLRR
jgi:hypothetical protein